MLIRRRYEAVRALGSGEPVRLSSLTPEHTAALVRQRLGVSAVPATLTRFIEDRVAGHPYFCEALVKTMQESGIVRVHDGKAVLGDFEGMDIPATVEGAVLSLVDRLTRHQQLSLKVAAVVGRAFSARAVIEAYPVSGERGSVPDDLRVLEKLELIEPEPSASEPMYVFRHDIAREVTYKLLTESQLRPLHRAVAEWYERTHSREELDLQSALLAYHWTRADDRARAVPYLENAGRGALRSGAFREAAQFFGDADLGPDTRGRQRGAPCAVGERRGRRSLLPRRPRAQPEAAGERRRAA